MVFFYLLRLALLLLPPSGVAAAALRPTSEVRFAPTDRPTAATSGATAAQRHPPAGAATDRPTATSGAVAAPRVDTAASSSSGAAACSTNPNPFDQATLAKLEKYARGFLPGCNLPKVVKQKAVLCFGLSGHGKSTFVQIAKGANWEWNEVLDELKLNTPPRNYDDGSWPEVSYRLQPS